MLCNVYKPRCTIEYDRFAYVYPINDLRITFDAGVRASPMIHTFFDEKPSFCPVMPFGHTVMEVKYNHFIPSFVRDVVNSCGATQSSSSKYCLARQIGR